MALETAPASSQSDGRWRVTYVPTGSNALSVAILNGGTAKPLTYSITADGFNYSVTQATVEDPRLTMVQDLSRPGRVTETLELTCVASTVADTADAILLGLSGSGAEGQLLVRTGVDNATTHTTGQKADLITFVVGVRRPNAPVANGVDTVTYTLFFTKATQRQATLVA